VTICMSSSCVGTVMAAEKSHMVLSPGRYASSLIHARMAPIRSDCVIAPSPKTNSIPASRSM